LLERSSSLFWYKTPFFLFFAFLFQAAAAAHKKCYLAVGDFLVSGVQVEV
jgi:hypothetical protein